MALLRIPQQPPPFWPRFRSPLHAPAVVARVGRVLGIMFAACFVTGLISHYAYRPWGWLPFPAAPVWGYRLTQGVHVITGIAIIPLLLVKLWTVYPRLFEWPPARSALHALERALTNVVANAIRHTPWDGTVRVSVGLDARARDEATARVVVLDQCGGIAAEDLARVFDVGFRGEAARTPDEANPAGAGMGLAITRGIVEAHDGMVRVVNHTAGCQFIIDLPLAS